MSRSGNPKDISAKSFVGLTQIYRGKKCKLGKRRMTESDRVVVGHDVVKKRLKCVIYIIRKEKCLFLSLSVYLCFYGLVYGLISQVNALNDRLTDKLIRLKLNFHCTMIALKLAFQVT